jgi:hypothetical protein
MKLHAAQTVRRSKGHSIQVLLLFQFIVVIIIIIIAFV